jgi:predicted membrane protein (TIGR00267 family)
MIFGLNDGLVSTLAFVMGAYGAFMESRIVLISGFAELLAGTISMAVSSYQSTKSEVEVIEKESKDNFLKKNKIKNQKKDLIKFYQSKGFTESEAEAIIKKIQKDSNVIKGQKEEIKKLGLSSEKVKNPIRSGFLCGLSFGLAALVPIFAFALPIKSSEAVIISIFTSTIALFSAGVLKTIFSRKNWIRSGIEMMIIGIGAAIITFFIGNLFSLFV